MGRITIHIRGKVLPNPDYEGPVATPQGEGLIEEAVQNSHVLGPAGGSLGNILKKDIGWRLGCTPGARRSYHTHTRSRSNTQPWPVCAA